MKKKYNYILIFLCLVLQLLSMSVVPQKTQRENQITITSVVKDENGNPIKGAIVYSNEGAFVVKTDALGMFTIPIADNTGILIESDGYEPAIYEAGQIKTLKEFSLKASLFLYGSKDVVNVAFGKVKKGDLVNAVSVLRPDDILRYDNIQSIAQALTGRVPGLLGSSNIRGIGDALFIVDGLPRDISTINLSEIDQITVLKDVNSTILYGNAAVNGVIMITTKRGQAYKKQINISGYYGVSTPTALPKYLSSADYMELYNEARVNDGLKSQYDATAIANYRSGNPYRYPNVDYYSAEYLKNIKPFSHMATELSGGNDIIKYYSNLGWEQSGNLLNFGNGKSDGQNKFNIRGNVDLKINSWIKSSLDAVAYLGNEKKPVGGDYWSEASLLKPNLFAPLIPINLIDPEIGVLKGRKNDVDGIYLLGGTSNYLTNPIANGYSGGNSERIQRTFSFNNRIDIDLDRVTKGLTFHTNVSFDYYTIYDQSITNSYSVYNPVWNSSANSIVDLVKYGSDARSGTQQVSNASFQRRFGFYGMFDYDRTFNDVHHVSGSLLGYANKYKIQGDFQGNKNANLGLSLTYGYKNKYLVDFSGAYVNSVKLSKGNRAAFSPSLGLAWVVSSEDFMSSVSAIDYLKLRLSAGSMNSDAGIDGFYYYDNIYALASGYSWFEGAWGNSGTISRYGGNNKLSFEKRKEVNFGFESILLDHKLSLDANLFTSVYFNQQTRPQTQYPVFYTDYIPYENFNSNSYNGAELGVSYKQDFGDFSVVIGANAMYTTSKVVKKDEIYANDYQYREGHPVDAIFGLVADNFFNDQADIDAHAIQAFGKVRPGDIKYVDQNKDGIIDANDEVPIGRWQAPFSYGLSLKLSYKNLTLFIQGSGQKGANGYLSGNYYWVDGDDKYSDVVLTRWTEATKTTATYPRISSQANTNNYRSSTFWQYKDNYFTVNRVQLTYEIPENIFKMFKMQHLSFYVDATNLLTISKHKDIRELSVGSEPFYRSFSIGVKTMF